MEAEEPSESPEEKQSTIINCAHIQLTATHIALLKPGLKFTPVPRSSNHVKLSADIRLFSGQICLKEFFHGTQCTNESIAKNPSHFTPPTDRDEYLDKYCDFLGSLASNLDSIQPNNKKDNLTPFERLALKELVSSYKIIIMPANKGGSVVVLEADRYRLMVKSIFDDPDYFEPCQNSQSKEIFLEKMSLCRKYANNLTKDEVKFLSKFDSIEVNFYGLPKVHKSEIIKRAILEQKSEVVIVTCPSDLKVRPIIAGPASPTSHLSIIIDTLLKPYMLKLPSYVRDSIDLLNHAKAWKNDESEVNVLLSMDVEAMYMNISESLGLKAITYFLNIWIYSLLEFRQIL